MSDEVASFIAKWAERDPAIRLVLLFAPGSRRHAAGVWFALLREIEDAALERSAPQIAAAKLAFYAREFAEGVGAAHPLVRLWRERSARACGERLAAAARELMELVAVESAEELSERLRPWAAAAAEAAEALFGEVLAAPPIAADFLLRRLAGLQSGIRRGQLWLPLDLLAAEGLDRSRIAIGEPAAMPALARARARLASWWLARIEPGGGAVGGVLAALVRLRLGRLSRIGTGADWPALRALWTAWRAARAVDRDC